MPQYLKFFDTEKGRIYFLGAHDHYSICKKCKELEEMNDEDTLVYMWRNVYITDDFEYAGWKIYKNSVYTLEDLKCRFLY